MPPDDAPSNPPTTRHDKYEVSPDGPQIAYTLYSPSRTSSEAPHVEPSRLAIVAHPLGRLGGTRQDHVVVSVAHMLAHNGYTVLTYDSRGSGQSTGSPSFSLVPESEDYSAMLNKLLLPLAAAAKATTRSSTTSLSLALVGYSAGSVASSMAQLDLAAARTLLPSLERVDIKRVLISYPLSVLWALTLFRSTAFSARLEKLASPPDSDPTDLAVTRNEHTLAVFGTQDQFTAVAKYEAWSDKLQRLSDGSTRWRGFKVEGADHFWRDREGKKQLLMAVREFVAM
ncbi:hypothetical protein ACM66B_006163 [Microbotryomycetes sp. NB124-2]